MPRPLTLAPELHAQFLAEAAAAHRPASEVLRELMQSFVERQREARAHDAWFSAQVEQGLREADDPAVDLLSHEEVAAGWGQWKAGLLGQARAE